MTSFTQMHNDHLDPDRHLWPEEGPETSEMIKPTAKQRRQLRDIKKQLATLDTPTYAPVTWQEYWDGLAPHFGQIKTGEQFLLEDGCDNDNYPEWCSGCDTWEAHCHALDHGRDEDGLYIIARDWDGDDWSEGYEVRKDTPVSEWNQFQADYMGTDTYFRAWAEYFIWCAEHGAQDPIETYWKKENCTMGDLIKSAREQIKYLKMGRKAK